MGFSIFASGSDNFHFYRTGCEDGSTFALIDLISTLQSLDITSLKGFGMGYANSKLDPTNDPVSIVDVMGSILYKSMLEKLSLAVCLLSMKSTSGGWIYVDVTETNKLWADTRRAVKYSFSPKNSPSAEFMKMLINPLNDTDMNNFGVLQQLTVVLGKYSTHIDDTMTPRINISLTN